MKKILFLLLAFFTISCHQQTDKNAFVGTWHLEKISENILDKGVIIYSAGGQMTAVLSKKDGKLIGYSGRYEVNPQGSYVIHYRDFYAMLPYTNDTTASAYIRDYKLSADKKTLTLRPREEKGLSLTWKKVSD